jgi:hypothetical protein
MFQPVFRLGCRHHSDTDKKKRAAKNHQIEILT